MVCPVVSKPPKSSTASSACSFASSRGRPAMHQRQGLLRCRTHWGAFPVAKGQRRFTGRILPQSLPGFTVRSCIHAAIVIRFVVTQQQKSSCARSECRVWKQGEAGKAHTLTCGGVLGPQQLRPEADIAGVGPATGLQAGDQPAARPVEHRRTLLCLLRPLQNTGPPLGSARRAQQMVDAPAQAQPSSYSQLHSRHNVLRPDTLANAPPQRGMRRT